MSKSAASKSKSQLKRKKEHRLYVEQRNQIKLEEVRQVIMDQVSVYDRTLLAYRQFLNIISDEHRKIFESLANFKILEEQFADMQIILDELKEIATTANNIKTYDQFFNMRFTELNYRQVQFAANFMESSKTLDVEIKKQTPVTSIELSDGFLPETGELIADASIEPTVLQDTYNFDTLVVDKSLPITSLSLEPIVETSLPID